MKNIAIFASGNGTNAEQIARHFKDNNDVTVKLILTNNPGAGVLKRAERLNIPTLIFNRDTFYNKSDVGDVLRSNKIDLVVLAGFMWLVPANILNEFENRIVNIHPALLPKYGGKGMYGHHVHKAVLAAKEKESGITIHYVNEKYDEGQIIFQAMVTIDEHDTPDTLAKKIHKLEYEHYPRVIEEVLSE